MGWKNKLRAGPRIVRVSGTYQSRNYSQFRVWYCGGVDLSGLGIWLAANAQQDRGVQRRSNAIGFLQSVNPCSQR